MNNITKLLSSILIMSSFSAIAADDKVALTTGRAFDFESETHCVTIAKMAKLPMHELRFKAPKKRSKSMFTYNLGFAEGYVKAMTIALEISDQEGAEMLYGAQCK